MSTPCDCECARGQLLELGPLDDPEQYRQCPCQSCPDQEGQLHACTVRVHFIMAVWRRLERRTRGHELGGPLEDALLERPFCDDCEEHRRVDALRGALKQRRIGSGREGAASDGHGGQTDDPGRAQKASRVS